MNLQVVVSCEHGGHDVPAQYAACFEGAEEVLLSHRGWDAGALNLAYLIANACQTPLYFATTTRLLVELNRSLDAKDLFSEYTGSLSRKQKRELLDRYYHPYRKEVRTWIRNLRVENKQVLHISVHSFTPEFNGVRRETEIGLLFDPSRSNELAFCLAWQEALQLRFPDRRIDFNQPYAGVDDGFTTALRKRHDDAGYLGIELEVRNDLLLSAEVLELSHGIVEGLLQAIEKYSPGYGGRPLLSPVLLL